MGINIVKIIKGGDYVMKKFDKSTMKQINKIDLDKINTGDTPDIINFLMNVIEGLSSELVEAREELQRLRNKLAYYEKGNRKPKIKPSKELSR